MSRSRSPSPASERTPLIQDNERTKKSSRLPSFIALSILCVAVVVALAAGFVIPTVVEEYVKESLSLEPGTISVDAFTDDGVQITIHSTAWLDADKVKKRAVRNIGRAATYFAGAVESQDMEVSVYLPEYDNVLFGTAKMSPLVMNIRNQQYNHLTVSVDARPGDFAGIRHLVQDFANGKQSLDVFAVAKVAVKSGIFSLGSQTVKQFMHVKTGGRATNYTIESLDISEYGSPARGIKAKAVVAAKNPYRINFDVPSVVFDILLPGCDDEYLQLGTMKTDIVRVKPGTVHAGATAYMSQLPADLTNTCPGSSKSPLDNFVASYLGGAETKVYIRGGTQEKGTPRWVGEILGGVVPAPVPPHVIDEGDMVKNFSLSNVHFSLPNTPDGNPQLSAVVKITVGLPDDLDFGIEVNQVRADSEVFFEGKKLGRLDLREWQPSNSTKNGSELIVQSIVTNAPLTVTDEAVFSSILESMLRNSTGLTLGVKAKVDITATTALGRMTIREIPSKSDIYISAAGIGGGFNQTIKSIDVVSSTPQQLVMEAHVEVLNPTDYAATIPYMNVSLWHNNTRLGYGWGGFDIKPGVNKIAARASWEKNAVTRELLSQYISGYNTTMTVKSPHMFGLPTPNISVTVPMPHTFGKFMKETTMHILSSTATFVLFSPIPMDIVNISSNAFYNGTEIGQIDYDEPFHVDPGDTETPRLPVVWNTHGGFGLIRDALGGRLKLDARAECTVKIGNWQDVLWFQAKGLGANVKL